MAQKIYLPKNLGIYNVPRNSGIKGTAIDTDTLDVAQWITDAAADGTIVIAGGGGGAVSSVSGRTGAVTLTKSDVALVNVDNTSDVNKPISSATSTALGTKASQTQIDAIQTLTGVVSGTTTLAPFTGGIITQTTIKPVLQELSNAIGTVVATANGKQDKVQYKQGGTNVSTSGNFTAINIIGGTAVVNGGNSSQLDITIPSGSSTTNTLTSSGSSIISTVNGITGSISPSTGVIAQQLGFDATGVVVKQVPTVSSGIQTVINNGASIKYFVVSGTPVVTYINVATGQYRVLSTGGNIEVMRVQVDFNTTTNTDGTKSIAITVPTTQSGSMVQVPQAQLLNTQNGAFASTTSWLYRNQGSTPTISVIDGIAGNYVTVMSTGTNIVGTTATLVLNF